MKLFKTDVPGAKLFNAAFTTALVTVLWSAFLCLLVMTDVISSNSGALFLFALFYLNIGGLIVAMLIELALLIIFIRLTFKKRRQNFKKALQTLLILPAQLVIVSILMIPFIDWMMRKGA